MALSSKLSKEQYQTVDVDVLQLTYDTLLEHKACLDKLLDNISEWTLTTNENTKLADRSGARITTLLKWKKITNGLTKSKMNTVGASGDNPITKTTLYAPSYQTHTQGTMKLQPKITRRNNLRNRRNSSNNSRESLSDRSLRNAIPISHQQESCPTLTDRKKPVVPSQMKSDSALIDINHGIFEMRPTVLHLTVSEKTAEMQLCRINLASLTLDKL